MHNYLTNKITDSTPTPYYFYDMELLKQTAMALYQQSEMHDIGVRYAVKANSNMPVLRLMAEMGFGADCVSGEEVRQALNAGIPTDKIVFAGVGKTDDEIRYALRQNISCLNCESLDELEVINSIGDELGVKAPVALRINPGVDAGTHAKITTGTFRDKFGILPDELEEAVRLFHVMQNVSFKGLHFHVGSQITDMKVFSNLGETVNLFNQYFCQNRLVPAWLNLGGGLGVDYQNPDSSSVPDFEAYIRALTKNLMLTPDQKLLIEPGRSLTAQSGTLISKVLYVKKNRDPEYVIIDAGMNDLMRPALYGANHQVINLTGKGPFKKYSVAGPVCESSDVFARNIMLPEVSRGDLLAIRSAGAYGQSMASNYNLREKCASVYWQENEQNVHIAAKLVTA